MSKVAIITLVLVTLALIIATLSGVGVYGVMVALGAFVP